jgi:hypothetical protein
LSGVSCCKKSRKSIDHLITHCEVSRGLWSSILNLFGVEWVMLRWVIDLLVSWERQVGRGTSMEVMEVGSIVFNVVPLVRTECLEF